MYTSETIWLKAQEHLKGRLEIAAYEAWILPIKQRDFNGESITLEAPDAFFKDWVKKNYFAIIEEALSIVAGKKISLLLENAKNEETTKNPEHFLKNTGTEKSNPFGLKLNNRYTFENFVIGQSNKHAHACSMAVADSPAKAYNPLFIYGANLVKHNPPFFIIMFYFNSCGIKFRLACHRSNYYCLQIFIHFIRWDNYTGASLFYFTAHGRVKID